MRLFIHSIRRQLPFACITFVLYLGALLAVIALQNAVSMIPHEISPYEYASSTVDFFLGLIVSIPFCFFPFFMKKDRFLSYAGLRVCPKKYLAAQICASLTLCFLMVYIVNFAGIFFSVQIAQINPEAAASSNLSQYPLGVMQMEQPLAFGALWCAQKGLVCMLICLLGNIFAMYVHNLFVALLAPAVIVLLENFLTAVLGLEKYSLTTAFVLNRLEWHALSTGNTLIAIASFSALTAAVWIILRRVHERLQIQQH